MDWSWKPGGNGFSALPSHPSIRLWEDSRRALVAASAATAPPVQYTDKARFLAGEGIAFCAQPRPCSAHTSWAMDRPARLPSSE